MRPYSSYVSLAGFEKPYDLNIPGAVFEIKRALVALAVFGSDPNLNPDDPIKETIWQRITQDDSWDSSVADEFVFAMSRYKNLYGSNQVQQGGSPPTNMVGGLQPTASGLECLAGAVKQRLGGYPPMTMFLAWRGGTFDPPSSISGPASNAQVIPSVNRGAMASSLDYVPLSPNAIPEEKTSVAILDQQLDACWKMILNASNETDRLTGQQCIEGVRLIRNTSVNTINLTAQQRTGTTTVESGAGIACQKAGGTYDPASGDCTGVALGPGGKQLMLGGLGTAVVVVGAACAVAAIFLHDEKKHPVRA